MVKGLTALEQLQLESLEKRRKESAERLSTSTFKHRIRTQSGISWTLRSQALSSIYRGVAWDSNENMWRATFCCKLRKSSPRPHPLGFFPTEVQAARAYDEMVLIYRKYPHRHLNFDASEYDDREALREKWRKNTDLFPPDEDED